MLNKLCYKGFTSTPIYSIEDKVIYGHVDDVYGYISYESETLNGVEHAFREAVDDYLDTCEELGICPEPKVKVLA